MKAKDWVDKTWDDNDPDNYVFTRVDIEEAFKAGRTDGLTDFEKLMGSIKILDEKAIHRQLSSITSNVIKEYRKMKRNFTK